MKRHLVFALFAALSLSAVNSGAEEEKPASTAPVQFIQRIFPVKNVDVRHLRDLLGIFGVNIVANDEPRVLAVSGPKERVEAVAEAIRQLDVPAAPRRNVELTAYMIVASPKASDSGGLPAALDSVVKQLKTVFAYQGYRLLESFVLRGREGENGSTMGHAPSPALPDAPEKVDYEFGYSTVTVSPGDAPRMIRLDGLELSLVVPIPRNSDPKTRDFNYVKGRINTDIDIREGQKVVVGKANVDGSDSAFFLVVMAGVVE